MASLKTMVQKNIAKNVYPLQSNPYITKEPGQSSRYPKQSNQWGQGQKAPKIEVRKGMRISGYNDGSDYNPGHGITASGKKVSPEGVAVSDRSIPMGTKVYVNGKKYTVTDKTNKRIGKELGDTIDIWSNEPTSTIIKRGVSKADVQIVK